MKFFLFIWLVTLSILYPQKVKLNPTNNLSSFDFFSDDKNYFKPEKITSDNSHFFYKTFEDKSYYKIPLNWDNISYWMNISDEYNIWSVNLENEPIYLLIDTLLLTEGISNNQYEYWTNLNWYWENGILYLKNDFGNPDSVHDSLTVFYGGGWSSTSGNFNGDLYSDIAYSYSGGLYTYIHYGGINFSIKPDVRIIDDGFYLANAGDVNGDGFDELISAQRWFRDTVFFYPGSETGISLSNRIVLTTPEGYDSFGFGHAISKMPGDINGDGFSDLLIASASGYIFLYLGNSDGIKNIPEISYEFNDSPDGSSLNTSFIGDINNDGFDDLAVSYSDNIYPISFFKIHIFLGTSSGIDSTIYKTFEFPLTPAINYRAAEIGGCGDLNGDGIDDMIIGNQWYDSGRGQVYIFYGSGSGISDYPDQILNKPTEIPNTRFGADLSEIGDFNYDGFNDLIVGSTYEDKAYIFLGGSDGISNYADLVMTGNKFFGWSVSKAGNVLGDGENYLIVLEEFGIPYLIKYSQNVVPVEFTSFYAEFNKDFVELSWSTSSEKNNKGFEIQRLQNFKTTKLQDWEVIGFIPGSGTTSEKKDYTFIDKNLKAGKFLYRIKQVDYDGTFNYTELLEINIDFSPEKYFVSQNFPNPFNPSTTLEYGLPETSIVEIFIYNSIGENVYQSNEGIKEKGNHFFKWYAENYPSGIYYYTINAKSTIGKNNFTKTNKMLLLK